MRTITPVDDVPDWTVLASPDRVYGRMSASPAVSTLSENHDEVFLSAAKLLLKYADNILRYPSEQKYRSIRIGNSTFSTNLLPIKGAVECLFEMGFEEAETHLVFPTSASVEQLKLIRDSIAAERDQRLQGGPVRDPAVATVSTVPHNSAAAAAAASPPASSASASSAPQPSLSPPQPSLESSMKFFVTLQSNFQHVMLYEDAELQQKASLCIPLQKLSSAAQHKLQEAKEVDPDCRLGVEDFLVVELLRWFKQDFFSWVDTLLCSSCGGSTHNKGSLSPSSEDLTWDAQRVENHFCSSCNVSNRFPRYNNPEKLLETRRGRCGEWANCFTLCCRAVGLDARYIWCSKDHVWTEVYSVAQRRWLHCDSCENTCDKPLLYEVGWGKKLDYVLAFSKDQVVDVTWRYSCKHPEVLSRRTDVQEAWLRHTINGLNTSRQQSLSGDQRKQLMEKLLVEMVEFISPKKPKAGELGGRNSGSLAWRIARGEEKAVKAESTTQTPGYMFTPTEKERSDGTLHVCYYAAKDQYQRPSNSCEVIEGWSQCVWRKEGVFRKVENDWQMVYVARTEGSSVGRISWRFDVAPVGMKIKSVSVKACSQTFYTGKVLWSLESGDTSIHFSGDGEMQVFPGVSGCSDVLVVAELSGGDGDASWQHSQLFRQSLKDTDQTSLEVLVHLEDP